nr:hypothetical protein [Nocardia nova]
MRQSGFDNSHLGPELAVEPVRQVVEIEFGERTAARRTTDRDDEVVDAAGLREECRDLLAIGRVHPVAAGPATQPSHRRVEFVLAAAGDDDLGALVREQQMRQRIRSHGSKPFDGRPVHDDSDFATCRRRTGVGRRPAPPRPAQAETVPQATAPASATQPVTDGGSGSSTQSIMCTIVRLMLMNQGPTWCQ